MSDFYLAYQNFETAFTNVKKLSLKYNKKKSTSHLLTLHKNFSGLLGYKQKTDNLVLKTLKLVKKQEDICIQLTNVAEKYEIDSDIDLNTELLNQLTDFSDLATTLNVQIKIIEKRFIKMQAMIKDISKLMILATS